MRSEALELGQAARVEQLQAAPPAGFGAVTKAEVQIDGGHAHLDEDWREARVARIALTNERGQTWVTALTCICCAAVFWSRLKPLLTRLLADSPRSVLGFIGDGAPWILFRPLEHFPGAIGTLDLYHLKLHLYEMAGVLWGKGSKAGKCWVRRQVRWLKRGRIESWIKLLLTLRLKRPGCRWSDVGAARMLALWAAAITGRLPHVWAERLAT